MPFGLADGFAPKPTLLGRIFRWIKAGATLPEREPVLRAWLVAAPSQPLPRCLAAVELARLAANHGIVVRVQP